MDIEFPEVTNAMYIERFQQALRVMERLSATERDNFDIGVIARRTETGISACIAGHCGLDPWFQGQGFQTVLDPSIGDVSVSFSAFFGTCRPFLRSNYKLPIDQRVTADHAIAALKEEVERLAVNSPAANVAT